MPKAIAGVAGKNIIPVIDVPFQRSDGSPQLADVHVFSPTLMRQMPAPRVDAYSQPGEESPAVSFHCQGYELVVVQARAYPGRPFTSRPANGQQKEWNRKAKQRPDCQ